MNDRRRSKLESICPDAMKHYARIAVLPLSIPYFDRGSGDSECLICKNKLYDHPQHPHVEGYTVVITCTGQFFKL